MPNPKRNYVAHCLLIFTLSWFIPSITCADTNDTMDLLLSRVSIPSNLPADQVTPTTQPEEIEDPYIDSTSATKGKPEDQCQDIIAEQGLSPNDVIWYAENPGGQDVAITAIEGCELCVLGSGDSWKCSPTDPDNPGNGGSGGGFGGGDGGSGGGGGGFGGSGCGPLEDAIAGCGGSGGGGGTDGGGGSGGGGGTDGGGGSGGGGGTDGGGGSGGGGEIDTLVEVAQTVDQNSKLSHFPISRENAIALIQNWYLPRNVDAQARSFTELGIDVFHSLASSECSTLENSSSIWASGTIAQTGEGGDSLIWNNYTTISSGFATGACLKTEGDNRYGALLHLGRTELEHDFPTSGEYESDNIGAGIFYIDRNEDYKITTSLTVTQHFGEQTRNHYSLRQATIDTTGDRDAISSVFNVSYEGTNKDDLLKPFGLLSISYVYQEGFQENGFPEFTLKFDSRETWWLNLEGGLKYEKLYQADEEIDYRFLVAGAFTFLTNLANEEQYFTYPWGRTLGIESDDEYELGAVLHLGIKRVPKDNSKMRVELSGSAGYQAEVATYSAMLNFIFPIEDTQE